MDVVAEFLRSLPHEIRRAGGSPLGRLGLLLLALILNIGFYLPSIPAGTPGTGMPGLDKLVHLLVFALTVWAAGRVLAPRRRFPMGWIVIAAFAHGLFIELFQLVLLPERGAEAADLLFDVIGIALGVGLWLGERLRADRAGSHDATELEGAAGAGAGAPADHRAEAGRGSATPHRPASRSGRDESVHAEPEAPARTHDDRVPENPAPPR